MVIIGLGANLGDRLHQLRRALTLLKKIPEFTIKQVSPIYISDALLPDNAPSSWNMPYLNLAIRAETTLRPFALLQHTKEIEKTLGRTPEKNWGPRLIDIDILAWDNLVFHDDVLHIPHESLHERPFALWPLADIAPRWIYPLSGPLQGKTAAELVAPWGSRFSGDAPFHTRQIPQRVDTPTLVQIVNITPDSFSGDGELQRIPVLSAEVLRNQIDGSLQAGHPWPFGGILPPVAPCQSASSASAERLGFAVFHSAAEVVDIGAEATGPKAISISAETEWLRLEPVLKNFLEIRKEQIIPAKISVDTRHADVAEKALSLGVDWINDVSGLDDIRMREVIKQHTCDVVIMHHLGIPVSQQKVLPLADDPVTAVYQWGQQRIEELVKSGIDASRIIFDVGIGFGKTAEQSVELLQSIAEFKKLGVRLLVGHSRKSFLNLLTDKAFAERDLETVVTSLYLAKQEVDFLRVHNVEVHAQTFKISQYFTSPIPRQ